MRKFVWCATLAAGLGGTGLPPRLAAAEIGCCKIHCQDEGRVSVMVIHATELECEAYEPQCEVQWTSAECEPPPGEPGGRGFQMRIDP
jgi:hypothetical protein